MIRLLLAIASATGQLPAQDAVVEEFIRSLPSAKNKTGGIDADEQIKLSDLVSHHPQQKVAIEAAFAEQARCEATAGGAAVYKALRQSAKALGDDKLRSLTQFYLGADARRFAVLNEKKDAPAMLTASEQAELDSISRAYPLTEFLAASKAAHRNMFADGELLTALSVCEDERDTTLAKSGIRQ